MVSAFASAIFDSLICIHHVGVRVLAEMSSLLTQQRKLHFNLATVTNIAVSHPLDLEQLYLLHPLCMTFSSSVCQSHLQNPYSNEVKLPAKITGFEVRSIFIIAVQIFAHISNRAKIAKVVSEYCQSDLTVDVVVACSAVKLQTTCSRLLKIISPSDEIIRNDIMYIMRSSKVFELVYQNQRVSNAISSVGSWKHGPKVKAAVGKIGTFYLRLQTPHLLGVTPRNFFLCCMFT